MMNQTLTRINGTHFLTDIAYRMDTLASEVDRISTECRDMDEIRSSRIKQSNVNDIRQVTPLILLNHLTTL